MATVALSAQSRVSLALLLARQFVGDEVVASFDVFDQDTAEHLGFAGCASMAWGLAQTYEREGRRVYFQEAA